MPNIVLCGLSLLLPGWGRSFFILICCIFCVQIASASERGAGIQDGFIAPAPGSYKLNHIMQSPNGAVLDVDNKSRPLSAFTTGKITLLSFIYTTCSDANGCPLAYAVFYSLKREIENTPSMYNKIRLVSLSFDPQHDTPDIMRLYGGSQLQQSKGLEWDFLTTSSYRELQPLLDGFGQSVSVEANPKKNSPRAFSHVLKIFLIDETGSIREIYSSSYFVLGVVLNDMKTLLMEKAQEN